MKEWILCAAIKFKDQVFSGLRHENCRDIMYQIVNLEIIAYDKPILMDRWEHEEGFLTSKGRFVDRSEAMNIALKANQVEIKNGLKMEKLYSEDLY